jgi:hypothetical protein
MFELQRESSSPARANVSKGPGRPGPKSAIPAPIQEEEEDFSMDSIMKKFGATRRAGSIARPAPARTAGAANASTPEKGQSGNEASRARSGLNTPSHTAGEKQASAPDADPAPKSENGKQRQHHHHHHHPDHGRKDEQGLEKGSSGGVDATARSREEEERRKRAQLKREAFLSQSSRNDGHTLHTTHTTEKTQIHLETHILAVHVVTGLNTTVY